MKEARTMLSIWHQKAEPAHVPCDLPALDGTPAPVSGKTTDFYLANLAQKNGMQWATLDQGSAHPAALVLPQ
jgi:hypothetical protein